MRRIRSELLNLVPVATHALAAILATLALASSPTLHMLAAACLVGNLPDADTTTDQFLYYYQSPNQPTVYLFHSNQIPAGDTVLTPLEVHTLGQGLLAIHDFFRPVYGANGGFYGMDVEFKFDSTAGNGSELYIKQARPYPGWGSNP